MEDIICPPPDAGVLFSPAQAFGHDGPFELEIGCGKGGFLLRRAQACPDVSLLGIEWANKYFKYAADRMARWGLTNVRVMRADARHFVIHHLPAACLKALHVYHPDPWPKKRHHKRRLFQPAFVEAAARALIRGGHCAIQTDHAEYHEWITEALARATCLQRIEHDDPERALLGVSAQSNYEIKYRRQGRTIFSLTYRKVRC